MEKSFYWTALLTTGNPVNVWYISFNPDVSSAKTTNSVKVNSYKVRCVKSP